MASSNGYGSVTGTGPDVSGVEVPLDTFDPSIIDLDESGYGLDAANILPSNGGDVADWKKFNQGTDYSSLMWQARGSGDYKMMHVYETMRNAKIDAEHPVDPATGQPFQKTNYTGAPEECLALDNEVLGQIIESRIAVIDAAKAEGREPTTAEWAVAHEKVEEVRVEHMYSGGPDGASVQALEPGYDDDSHYMAMMSDAYADKRYKDMHWIEVSRNAKIDAEHPVDPATGQPYEKTYFTGNSMDCLLLGDEDYGTIIENRMALLERAATEGRDVSVEEWRFANKNAEELRARYGYSAGSDGSQYRRLDDKVPEPVPVPEKTPHKEFVVPARFSRQGASAADDIKPSVSGGPEFC